MSRTRDFLRKLLSGTVLQKPPPLSLRRVQPGHSLLVALEPRLVYDGAIAPTAVVAAEQAAPGDAAADGHSGTAATADHHDVTDAASHDAALPAAQAGIEAAPAPRVEIAFVDRNIRDVDALVKSLEGRVQVYWLDPAQNGVAQIGEVLSHYAQVDAVHIYSHADAAGELILGSTVVDIKNVDAYKQNLAAWGDHLSQGADIMLYGCDLAAGADGHALVDKIADYTHADVAASDDLTGAASAGGDWDLEVHHGIIETAVLADRDFDGVLTAPVLTGWDSTTLDTAAAQAGPVVIDSDVTLTSGLANYSGWQLEVSSPLSAEDVLFIRDEGSGAGQVGVQDAGGGYYLVNYGGNSIGYALSASGGLVVYFTDGFGTTPTNAMVERVIENLTYRNTSGSPTTSRQIDLQLSPNGGGGSSPLSLIDTETNGQDGASGLAGQGGITVSPDGKFVYVTAADDDGIAYFTRDTTTSVLTFAGKITNGSGGLTDMTGPTGIDISSDGKSLYVDDRNSGKVYFFQRNTTTGALTYSASYSLPASSLTGDLAISPDQTRVLVSRIGSVSIYDRNTTTGALTYIGYTSWSASGGGNTPEMVISPDGNSIYTAWGEGDFSFISRNPTTDALTRQAITVPAGFKALNGLAMSPDGKFVYLTDADSDAVAVYARDTTTGALTQTTVYYNGSGGISNLDAPYEIRISPDGLYAFVTAGNSGTITLFTRDTTTGALTYETALSAYNLNSASDMCLSPDGKAIYTSQDSFSSSTLNAFSFDASLIGGNDSTNASITLTLGVSNHAPTGADKTVTINEDAAYTFAAADFGFSDVDGGDSLSAVRIDSLPVNGTLKLSGVAVTVGQVIATANIGNLVFAPAADANGAAYANFNFSVRDQANAYDAAPNKITVNVTPVNDAPTGADKTVTINEDTTYTFSGADFGFSDIDAGDSLSAVRIDSLPVNGTLTLSGAAVSVGQVIAASSLGNLVFTPVANANGTAYASFNFSVRDQSNAFDAVPNKITLDVTPMPDVPVLTGWNPADQLSNVVKAGPVVIDASVSLSTIYSNFNNWQLILTSTDSTEAVLSVRNQGTGAGQIGVSGNTVTYGGVAMGTITGGAGTPLAISLNAAASDVAVEALIENLTYQSTASGFPPASRTLSLSLEGVNAIGTATYVGMVKDGVGGVDGLSYVDGTVMSADGLYLYAAGGSDNAVSIFRCDAATGALTYIGMVKDGVGGVDGLAGASNLSLSPDGKTLYVAGTNDNAVAIFSRDIRTGALTYIGMVQDGVGGVDGLNVVRGVTVSPDGLSVYAAGAGDNAIAVFARDPVTGVLSYQGLFQDGVGGVDGLNGARTIALSPDGKSVYVAGSSDNGLAVFTRDTTTGALTYQAVLKQGVGGVLGMSNPRGVAVSPDGKQVYVASYVDSAVAIFNRDTTTGALTYAGIMQDGVGGVDGLAGAQSVTISADGNTVYVAGGADSGIAIFRRSPATGALIFKSVVKDGVGGVDGLSWASAVTVSPNGRHIYVSGNNDSAIAIFNSDKADGLFTTATLNVTPVYDLPVITGWDPTGTVQENTVNAGYVVIDNSVTVTGDGNYNFTMILSTANFGGTQNIDQLAIRNQGTGAGQIGVSGSTITYGGVAIATYFNGGETDSNAQDLIIAFNGTASNAAVKALIENIEYANASNNPVATRTVTMRLEQGGLNLVGSADQAGQVVDYWSDGTYYYRAQTAGGIGAFSFDGTDLHVIRNLNTNPDYVTDIEGDGTYIYYTVGTKLAVARFDGTNWTSLASYDMGAAGQSLYCKNGYIFVADGANGVAAFTFDGTSLHLAASVDTPGTANRVWTDNTYYYVADGTQLIAYSFDGSSFTQRGSIAVPGGVATSVEGDGSFLYVGSPQQNNTLLAYSFDGTTFTQRASYSIPGSGAASDLQVSGGKIYLASGKEGLQVLSFDGTAFSLLSTQDRVSSGSSAQGVYVDAGGNIFLANRNEPTSVFHYSDPTNIAVYQKVLTVNAENDAPTGADKTVTVNEDTGYTFSAADFGFSDVDNGDSLSAVRIDSLPLAGTLKLSGVDVTLGQVITAANIGNLVFTPAADANGAAYADFNFSVRDQSGAYDAVPNKVTVDVTPVNDAPTGADKTITIDEDTFYSFVPSDFGFSDVDLGDGLSAIRIDSLPVGGRFKLAGINVSAGQVIDAADIASLVFTPAANANGVAYTSFNFSVRDASNAYDAAPNKITIDVTPVNDAPDGTDKNVTVNEDAAYTFAAADFGFSDVDTGDSLSAVRIDSLPLAGTLQLSGVDVTLGQVIAAANIGNLVFTPAADANGAAYASFDFSVRDQSNVYDDAPNKITIDVTPVNDAPTGADKTVTINEDASYAFSTTDFGFSDIDAGDSLSAVRIDSLPLAGTLKLSGVDVTLGQVITAANIGNLVFAPAADANGAAYANFNFSVRDQSNAYDAAPNKITVDVTPVNDAPTGADKTVTINEDASYTFSAADFGFADVDSGDSLSAVRIDSLPLAGTLKLSGVDVTLGQVIAAANIGNLVFTPVADANGAAYANFNFSVRDQSNAYDAAPNKITVDVTPVNDAPTGADKTVTVNEDAAYTFSVADFGFADVDSGDSLSAVRIDSLPLAGTLKLSGINVSVGQVITAANIGNLVFTPVADANGAAYANFNFSVRDQSNTYDAAPNKITVDVTPVNDAPAGADKTVTVNEDAAYTFSATDFGFSDIDSGDSLSAVRIDSLPLAGTLKLSGVDVTLGQVIAAANIGNLVFTPAVDANGAAYANFNFSVRDQSNAYDVAPNKITVDVTPVNDAPVGADKTVTVNEDAAYTFSAADFGFSDIDGGDSLSAVRIDSLPLAGTLKLSGVDVTLGQVITAANIGNLVFRPAVDANGAAYANFDFSVRDQSNAYDAAPNKITVDVTPVNDAPTGTDKTVTIDEDTSYSFTPADFGFGDIDAGDGLSAVRIDSLPAGGRLKLAGINVSAGQVIDAADIAGLVFTPAANANGAAYTSFNFSVRDQANAFDAVPNKITVDVTPVNDAPTGHDATIATNENTARSFTATDFGFGDVDAGDSLSAVQVDVPTAGTLALYGVAVTPGQVVAAADIAGLTFTPAAGVFGDGYAQMTFKVRDGAGAFSAVANTLTINVHKTGPTVAEDLTTHKPEEAAPPAAPVIAPPPAVRPEVDFVPVIASMLDKIRDVTAKQTMGRGILPEERAFYNAPRQNMHNVEVQRVAPGESHAITLSDLKHDLSQSPGARLSEVSLLDGSRPPAWISISDKGDQLVVTPPHGLTGVVNLSLRVETRNGPMLLPLRLDIENGAVVDSSRFALSFQDQLARQGEYHLSAEVEREVRRLIGE